MGEGYVDKLANAVRSFGQGYGNGARLTEAQRTCRCLSVEERNVSSRTNMRGWLVSFDCCKHGPLPERWVAPADQINPCKSRLRLNDAESLQTFNVKFHLVYLPVNFWAFSSFENAFWYGSFGAVNCSAAGLENEAASCGRGRCAMEQAPDAELGTIVRH